MKSEDVRSSSGDLCLAAATGCALTLAIGLAVSGYDNGMFVPLGGAGTACWLAYWLFALLWLVCAGLAVRRRHWAKPLLGGGIVAITLLPSALLMAACASGDCL